jgi:hypothetical protein
MDLPDGLVRARYSWNRLVLGEGVGYEGAYQALRRTHLMIGNSADGRWSGHLLGD